MNGKEIRISVVAENMPEVLAQARELDNLARELRKKKYNVDFSINMRKPRQAIMDFQKDFNTRVQEMQTRLVRFGSRMQTLGKAITNFTSPFTRIFTGALLGVGYSALNKITSGLSGAFERYDIMNTYSKQLQAMGFEAEDASKAIDKLRDSVLGLPTGLDEIVAAQKSYVGATNDVERATDLAIAANNAYIAGGTTARQKKYIQNQLLALSSGAELTTSQWQSLQRNAPMALRAVSKELGYADDAYDQFLSDLKENQISGKSFLDAFIKVGTEGSIRNAANVMKTTWDALSENITNRTRDMGEKVLEALDTVFEGYNGRNLIQNLLGFDKEGQPMGDGIRDWIDGLTASMVEWIKQNPTKILDFFENLKKIDIKGVLKGTFEELSWIAEKLVWLFDRIDGSKFAKYMIRGNILGRVLTLVGGLGKGLATPLAVLGVSLGGGLSKGLGKLFKGIGKGLGKLFKGKGIGSLFGSIGKGASAAIGGWQGVASKALNIAAIPVIVYSFKMLIEAFKELGDVNISWERFSTNMKQMGVAIAAFGGVAIAIGALSAILGFKTIMLVGTGILTALSFGISTLADAMNDLNNMVVPSPQAIDQKLRAIKLIVKPMQDMLNLFSEGGFFKNLAKAAENVSASWVISSIGNVVDAAKGVSNKAHELADLKIEDDLADRIGDVRTNFVPVAKGLELIIKAFSKDGVFANIHELLKNWTGNAIIDSIGNAATKVKHFYDTIKSLGEDKYDQSIMDNASEWLGGFQQLINSHYVTINAWNNKHMNADLSAYVQSMDLLGQAFGKLHILLEQFDNITTTVNKYIRSGSFIGDGDLFGNVRNRLGIITAFAEEISGEDGVLRKLQTLGGSLEPSLIGKIATAIDELKGVFINLAGLSDQMSHNPLFASNGDMGYGIGGLRHSLGSIVPAINDILDLLNQIETIYSLEGNIAAINRGLSGVGEMFDKIRSLAFDVQGGIFTEIQTLRAAISETAALGQNMVNVRFVLNFIVDPGASVETTEGIITSYINAVLVYVDMLDTNVTKKITVTLTCEVLNFHAVVEKLKTDRNIIMDAIDDLNITRTRRVTVNLETRTNGGGEYYPHTGGLITDQGVLYRAKGGSIFKPKGTDIVPAMLTPGEYVMSRGAVDAFGARFMQRINNLDIPGAIRELSIRTGRKLAPASQIINNTTDNRSYSNTQHINTNNPNFAFRRSRWVSELR